MFASETHLHLEIISLNPFSHVSSFPRRGDLLIRLRSFSKYVYRRLFARSLISLDICTNIITSHAQTSWSRTARRHGAIATIQSLQCPCQCRHAFHRLTLSLQRHGTQTSGFYGSNDRSGRPGGAIWRRKRRGTTRRRREKVLRV